MDNQIIAYDKFTLLTAMRLKRITRKQIADDLCLSAPTVTRLLDNPKVADARAERNWLSVKHYLYEHGIVVNYR